jgi:hypothetical protein
VAVVLASAVVVACKSSTRDPLAASLVPPVDAGGDAGLAAADGGDEGGAGDGGLLGKPCTDDPQCDDGVACTFDSCDPATHRCANVPDDTQCQDGLYCDGHEICVPFHGCESGPVVTCDDTDPCTIDACVESSQSCAHAPRDADVDGDPDGHCVAHHDCDDLDPTVSSVHSEVCANGKDDNCNGVVDETPCTTPADATCATALSITASGTYSLSTAGSTHSYPTSCSVASPAASHQAVALVTIPPGPARDIDAWATAGSGQAAVAIESTCGNATSEIACNASAATTARARARSLAPGTYAVIVTTQDETSVELAIDLLDATTPPPNESCAAPLPITPGTTMNVSLIDATMSLASQCGGTIGELTYALTLAQTSDVRVFASTTRGSGEPIVGIRATPCTPDVTDELRCRATTSQPLFARALAAGQYVVTIAATGSIDATLLVQTSAPTTAPPDQTCATAPALATNTSVPVDLSNNESAIDDGCFAGGPDAAFDLSLAKKSDVILVARVPQVEAGAVSLDTPACNAQTTLACSVGGTPARVNKRALAAGDYRVVIADSNGASDTTLTAYVRDTVTPTIVTGADTCAAAQEIPPTGGFFTGDTSKASADYDDSCDVSSAAGGAPDQVLHLALAQPQHVVFDMSGSTYTTILDVHHGATCPGTELPGGCYVGYSAGRSFLDVELAADDYWIVVDGYAGQSGPWDLDVRVLPP